MAGHFENGNKQLGFTKGGRFLYMRNIYFIFKNPDAWNCSISLCS